MTVNPTLLAAWLMNVATVVGGGFAVFGDPSLAPVAKEAIAGLVPVMVSVLTYSTHSLQSAKVKAAAATPSYLPSPKS